MLNDLAQEGQDKTIQDRLGQVRRGLEALPELAQETKETI